jgi:hypothetical protein
MAGITTSMDVTGVAPFLAKLQEISDPRKLERTTRASLGRAAKKVIAPRMAKGTGWKYGGHGGRYPTKGILGSTSKISARKVRIRQGEYVAVSVKFRGWPGRVAAWAAQGTDPHVIRARGDRGGPTNPGTYSKARAINRGTAMLAFSGRYAARVSHPGAAPTDFVHDAVQGTEHLVMEALTADLFKAMDRAASGKK